MSIKTRGKLKWVLSGLLVWGWTLYVRIYKGRFGLQNKFKRCLVLGPQAEVHRESSAVSTPTISGWRTTATVSTELQARRATGLTVAEREGSFTRTEAGARWSREGRAAYEAVREALLLLLLFFLTGARCPNEAGNSYIRD